MKRYALLVFFLVWVLGGLACKSLPLPAVDIPYHATEPALELPTAAPNLAAPEFEMPTPAPTPAPPPAGEALTITGSGTKLDFSGDGVSCQVPATAVLLVNPDGTARLTSVGLDIIDHYNCKGDNDETWYIDGTADNFSQTAGFASCNFGGFSAEGAVTYADQKLLGTVSCFYTDGTLAVTLEFK